MKTGQCCSPSRPPYEAIVSQFLLFCQKVNVTDNLWQKVGGKQQQPHEERSDQLKIQITGSATCLLAPHLKRFVRESHCFVLNFFVETFANNYVESSDIGLYKIEIHILNLNIFRDDLKTHILLLCYTRIVLRPGSRLGKQLKTHRSSSKQTTNHHQGLLCEGSFVDVRICCSDHSASDGLGAHRSKTQRLHSTSKYCIKCNALH